MKLEGRVAIVTGSSRGIGRAIALAYAQEGARVIINVTSINGTVAFPQRAAYCVSKAGVNMFTKVLAIEWADRGIRVNALAPGYVDTDLIRDLVARGLVDRARLEGRTPIHRLAMPEEVAEAAVFLASDAARYITGTVLTIDGGWTAYGYV